MDLNIQNNLNNFSVWLVNSLPKVLGIVLLVILTIILAKVARYLVKKLLNLIGLDKKLNELVGSQTGEKFNLAHSLSEIAFYAVLLLMSLPILDTLGLGSLVLPIQSMITKFTSFLPNLLTASIILLVFYFISRVIYQLVYNFLLSIGFDNFLMRFGFVNSKESSYSLSKIVAIIVQVVIVVTGLSQALQVLQLPLLTEISNNLISMILNVAYGVVIIAVGLFIANKVSDILLKSGIDNNKTISTVTKVAIIVLTAAMGLNKMGLASEIVNLTFGLTLGAVALGSGIAFGMGGKDAAKKILDELVNKK